jgi:exodeoxyribonuclease-3
MGKIMKVLTLNVNGIRSSLKKGLREFLLDLAPDVICLQETRCTVQEHDAVMALPGYVYALCPAEKKGYSGVAMYSRRTPLNIVKTLGFSLSDDEGRYLAFEYDDYTVASMYFPSGSSADHRQDAKYLFMDEVESRLLKKHSEKPMILTGDWNIAHTVKDIKNAKSNEKSSGFLPRERDWLTHCFSDLGWIDAFRAVDDRDGQYTWWSTRRRAYEHDVGWRIDYQIVSKHFKGKIKSAKIFREARLSDHAPVLVEYDVTAG